MPIVCPARAATAGEAVRLFRHWQWFSTITFVSVSLDEWLGYRMKWFREAPRVYRGAGLCPGVHFCASRGIAY